jgi:hypothetical protein
MTRIDKFFADLRIVGTLGSINTRDLFVTAKQICTAQSTCVKHKAHMYSTKQHNKLKAISVKLITF